MLFRNSSKVGGIDASGGRRLFESNVLVCVWELVLFRSYQMFGGLGKTQRMTHCCASPWSGSIASLGYADAKSRARGNGQRNRDRAFLKMESPRLPFLIFKVHPYHSTYQNCVPFFFLKGSLPLTAVMRSGIQRMPPARKVCAAC